MITDNSYDYLRGAIASFGMLDDISRRALFEELRGMLSTALGVQAKNEEFKREYYSHYALLESSMEDQREQIKELESQNAELAALNAQLEVRMNQLTQRVRHSTVHVMQPRFAGESVSLTGVKEGISCNRP